MVERKLDVLCQWCPTTEGYNHIVQYLWCLSRTSYISPFLGNSCHQEYIGYGAYAANVFTVVPPPKSPLFLKIDDTYKNWCKKKTGILLSENYMLRFYRQSKGTKNLHNFGIYILIQFFQKWASLQQLMTLVFTSNILPLKQYICYYRWMTSLLPVMIRLLQPNIGPRWTPI